MPSRKHIVLATPAPVSNRTAEENLGLGYLASVLRGHGYPVSIIDGWLSGLSAAEIADRILADGEPLWIGFSCYRTNMEPVMQTARLLRNGGLKAPILAGGFGPTFHASDFLAAGIDVVVRGEGEDTVLELSRHLESGQPPLERIAGISFRRNQAMVHNPARPLVPELDALPLPSRDTLPLTLARKSPVHLVTSRGCPAHCVFCSVVAFMRLSHGPQWRERSVQAIVSEIESLAQQGARWFKVVDDSLLEAPRELSWCTAFADEIQRRNLNVCLRGMVRADRVNDDVVAELHRAGFNSFYVGLESFSSSALRRMAKTASVADNLQALAAFRKHGVYVNAGHILFDHLTTLSELRENLEGMRAHEWVINKSIFTEMFAAEGTPYTRLLDRRGLIELDRSGLGNHRYQVQDPAARAVYHGLKQWNRNHSAIYDKAIDPIASPKALEPESLACFHDLYLKLRRRDLQMLSDLISLAEHGSRVEEAVEFAHSETRRQASWYRNFETKVDHAYAQCGLIYDAAENPFLC